MYTRIVSGIDGSELANKALDQALTLASHFEAQLFVVIATEPSVILAPDAGMITIGAGDVLAELEKAKKITAATVLDNAEKRAEAAGVVIDKIHIPASTPADALLGTAAQQGADLIVMGSHGRRGLGRLLLGSQAAEVLARATIPVLVVK